MNLRFSSFFTLSKSQQSAYYYAYSSKVSLERMIKAFKMYV